MFSMIKLLYSFIKQDYSYLFNFFKIKFEKEYTNPSKRLLKYDRIVLLIAEKVIKKYKLKINRIDIKANKPHVLFLFSEIYDHGGHTELILRFANALKENFKISFLSTGLHRPMHISAPVKYEKLKTISKNIKEFSSDMDYEKKVLEVYSYILKKNVTSIIVTMHMYDTVSCAVLGLIKKYTNINIFFVNIGEQYFTLGINHSSTILTRIKNNNVICPHINNPKRAIDIPILEATNDVNLYSNEEIIREKEKLNIPVNNFVTLTGVIPLKIMADPKQNYFKLLRKLLIKNQNMTHILLTKFNKEQEIIFNNILGEYANRVIIKSFMPNFDFYIQLSDLYIDSFPQGSALTLIDYIKHSKPVVVKIDEKYPIRSFEDYVGGNYEYACRTKEDMYEKISKLINDKDEYKKLQTTVREHYINRYNIEQVKRQYLRFIR